MNAVQKSIMIFIFKVLLFLIHAQGCLFCQCCASVGAFFLLNFLTIAFQNVGQILKRRQPHFCLGVSFYS